MGVTTIRVCGASIRVMDVGAGPTILYLHGLDGPRVNPLVSAMAQNHRVLAPELPGFGRAGVPEWMTGMADLALFGLDLVEAIIETFGETRLHLAGHCIGGWMAVEMALRHATPFATLSLIAPMGVMPNAPPFDIFVPEPDAVVRAQFHDAALAEAEIVARANEDIDIVLQNRTGLARLAWSPRFASVALPFWLHRVRTPTLLFWGEQDGVTPVECCDVYARQIAGAKTVRYPNCGHAAPWERGSEIAKRMTDFIAEARA